MVLDTGSADLWIAGSGCTASSGCTQRTHLYELSQSTSMQHQSRSQTPDTDSALATFNVSYGFGEASGNLVSDVVSMAGFTIPDQTFASCNVVSAGLVTGNVSGILGLGFQTISTSQAMPFWQALATNYSNQLAQFNSSDSSHNDTTGNETGVAEGSFEMGFAFTRFLHDPESVTHPMRGGSMSFGHRNESLYTGDIVWNELTQVGYWMIQMDDIALDNSSMGIQSATVAIDT